MENYYEKKKIIIRYVIFCVGVFFNYSGYLVLLNLQSSINIEDGIGLASITATYATSAVFGILVTPIILRKLGPQICIIFCEITYLLYILANAYPVSYTLIPASVLTGMGEATMWPVMNLFVVHYARCYARYGEDTTNTYITQLYGTFYALFQFSGVFGNLIGYAIFYGGSVKSPVDDNNETTSAPQPEFDLSICGKNDCQDPNVTNANEDRYEPASETLIYILVGVTGCMVLCAMFIHKFLTKPIDTSLEVQDRLLQETDLEKEQVLTTSYEQDVEAITSF